MKHVIWHGLYETFRFPKEELGCLSHILPSYYLLRQLEYNGFNISYLPEMTPSMEYAALLCYDLPYDGISTPFLNLRLLKRKASIIIRQLKENRYVSWKKLTSTLPAKCIKVLYLFESRAISPWQYLPENHNQFDLVFTYDRHLVRMSSKYRLQLIPSTKPSIELKIKPFLEKNFACMINSNKSSAISGELYSERRAAARAFEKFSTSKFSLYGQGWQQFASSRGSIEDKISVLTNYRFSLCYENFVCSGYITEKIFDCFYAKVVPVYLGAPDILEWIPQQAFIDRRNFQNNNELIDFLVQLSPDCYQLYLSAAHRFITSVKFNPFSQVNFSSQLISALNQ